MKINVLLTSCNIDFFFPLNLGESHLVALP